MEQELKQLSEQTMLVYNDVYKQLCVRKSTKLANTLYITLQELQFVGVPRVLEIHNTHILLEYIEGLNLAEYIAQNGVSFDIDVFMHGVLLAMCAILLPIHQAGIIHKDIKPENIVVTKTGQVALIDFDVARMSINEGRQQDTELFGTRGFASPEHFGFQPTDQRSDIYSLGKVLERYTTHKVMLPIIEQCTKVDANRRYQNVEQLQRALLTIENKLYQPEQETTGINKIQSKHIKLPTFFRQKQQAVETKTTELKHTNGIQKVERIQDIVSKSPDPHVDMLKQVSKPMQIFQQLQSAVTTELQHFGDKKTAPSIGLFHTSNIVHIAIALLAIFLIIGMLQTESTTTANVNYTFTFTFAMICFVVGFMLLIDGIIFIGITIITSLRNVSLQKAYVRVLMYIGIGIAVCVVGFVVATILDVILFEVL